MLSVAVPFSELLMLEVYSAESLAALEATQTPEGSTEPLYKNLDAVVLITPTASSILQVAKELKHPQFRKYHILFTGPVSQSQIERLARCDVQQLVTNIGYGHVDFLPLAPRLASLQVDSFAPLLHTRVADWQAAEYSAVSRVVEGIVALSAAHFDAERPAVRFVAGSSASEAIAAQLSQRYASVTGTGLTSVTSKPATILLLDRREDPVTPLLNQWTYHAMVNELLDVEDNKVTDPDGQSYHISRTDDEFFAEHALSDFGKIGDAITQKVDQYKDKSQGQLKTVDDVRNFMEHLPQFKENAGTIVKHVAIIHALNRLVDQRQLLQVSEVEQEIASSENRAEQLKRVRDLLESDVPAFEKFRVVLLFFLRYEPDSVVARELEDGLRAVGVEDDQIKLIAALMDFAGSARRSHDLFRRKDIFGAAKNRVVRQIQGVANVYTQHRSFLHSLLSRLLRKGISADELQFTGPGCDGPCGKLLVVVLGGATLEESRDVEQLMVEIVSARAATYSAEHRRGVGRNYCTDFPQILVGCGHASPSKTSCPHNKSRAA
ncbi:MAG: uncharacterized protein KVP18_000974 [Porospora cf. gigantea A]|uniref:uncharacterized protein n=1 Tax=Porospora cf. gigantea A TaxID=2853593 RepID=UPI00355A3EE1|nr:MAG: hypothetical protein KVP18_000974 [Porospora cf. gigantea A]